MDTKALANRVAAQHGTRDPFRIAEELGFIVIRAPLVEMRGLRQYVKRRTIVYVNACLDEPQQRLVCAPLSPPGPQPPVYGPQHLHGGQQI